MTNNQDIRWIQRFNNFDKAFSDVDIALIGDFLDFNDLLYLKTEIDDLLLPYEFDFCIYKDLKNKELKRAQWKFSGDKHKSLQVYTERTFHQRYLLVML
mgnify:CR=1 FL=1